MPKHILIQVAIIICSTLLLGVGIYLLSIYRRLFKRIQNRWLRMNLTVLSISLLMLAALLGIQSPAIFSTLQGKSLSKTLLSELGGGALIVFFVFNIVWFVSERRAVNNLSFVKKHGVIVLTIVITAIIAYAGVNYAGNGWKMIPEKMHRSLVYAYMNSILTGFIYTAISYVELERKRKLNEKELEVTRLIALKTKAELETLHSKVNPHFLYNALNSIADLSITDGKKARRMTIALADLFRYSINYSNSNYSTVKDEIAMAEVYLQIEKIRFEDQLNYTIAVEEGLDHYLVPRFILQPIVENAVKHGLKATGKMTEIELQVRKEQEELVIAIADNGPAFPETLNPGYGLKSIFDKLDLLFPGNYELHFANQPNKQVILQFKKLVKNEPPV